MSAENNLTWEGKDESSKADKLTGSLGKDLPCHKSDVEAPGTEGPEGVSKLVNQRYSGVSHKHGEGKEKTTNKQWTDGIPEPSLPEH